MYKIISLCVFLIMAFVNLASASTADLTAISLKQFPEFSTINLSAVPANKPLYIKMWATWCKPCMEQMPHFQQLYQQYGDKVNFVAVNIDINEKPEEIAKVIARFGLTMPVWIDNQGKLALELGLVGTPFSVLMNSQWQQVYTSHESDNVLDGFIQRLAQGQNLIAQDGEKASPEQQQQLVSPYLNGEQYLFFTATWCDWYLAESRPDMSKSCIQAQQQLNAIALQLPNSNWHGIVNNLWTDQQALTDFNQQYAMKVPFSIDNSGALFQHFNVRSIPVLLKLKDGKVLAEIKDFSNPTAVIQQLQQLQR